MIPWSIITNNIFGEAPKCGDILSLNKGTATFIISFNPPEVGKAIMMPEGFS
jgi:hypothetical protein